MKKGKILVVDDEEAVRSSLADWLAAEGYEVMTAENGETAWSIATDHEIDLALVDLKMPRVNGIDVLRKLIKIKPGLPVVIITAFASVDSAVLAMKEGAVDYVVKPFNPDEISIIIERLTEHQRLVKENTMLRRELTRRYRVRDLIGKSPKMAAVFEMIKTVAPTKSTVFIRGESGTGKELVARAIHGLSLRNNESFIAAACGAIPETLLEAELFGYEKGAFTGATTQHMGRIEMADKGTIFLDEIGDISPKTQVDLLRFLQEREFRRIGGKELIKVDIRIIAATNKNIEEMIANRQFREDLYYRLNVITITIPPLRERKEDIPILIEHFFTKYSVETNKPGLRVSEDAMKVLMEYHWPGNVRELENTIEHAIVVTSSTEITVNDLPAQVAQIIRSAAPTVQVPSGQSLNDIEKAYISNVLNSNNWNIKRSAEILGINRVTLYNKIKLYQLKKTAE
ncbi:MAG TPA: sigma-54 dependent transcriptional regulator [bacterium]